jgi:PEP-CTERM motif
MKIKIALIVTLGMLSISAYGVGTVSLNFNAEFDSGVPQGLSDVTGVATNGMIWGILIDGSGNGLSGSYESTAIGTGSSYILNISGAASDDVLWTSTILTSSTATSTEGDGVTKGGVGGFYEIVDVGLENGVEAGDKFYVVWFSGGKGGVLSDPSFIVPAASNSSTFATPFVGLDPNRSAGLAYAGTSGESTGAGFTLSLVPEPSSLIFGALGVLGFFRRRRN